MKIQSTESEVETHENVIDNEKEVIKSSPSAKGEMVKNKNISLSHKGVVDHKVDEPDVLSSTEKEAIM